MRAVLRWLPCLLWMAVIYALSSRTGDDMNAILPIFQWLVPAMENFDWGHFVAYFILSLAYIWLIGGAVPTVGMKIIAVLLCELYGLTDEFHQSFVPGRAPDWHDVRNDGIGAFLAMLLLSVPLLKRGYRTIYMRFLPSTKY